jgi:hypothetical protein
MAIIPPIAIGIKKFFARNKPAITKKVSKSPFSIELVVVSIGLNFENIKCKLINYNEP